MDFVYLASTIFIPLIMCACVIALIIIEAALIKDLRKQDEEDKKYFNEFDKHEVLVRYHKEMYGEDLKKIKKIKVGDFIDLRCSEDTKIEKGQFKLIPLGISMKIPAGYFAIIVPRSSTYKNYHIIQANSVGIIDNSYCGDGDIWRFPALATEDTEVKKNERICQFTLIRITDFDLVETAELEDENRSGFGSTGTK